MTFSFTPGGVPEGWTRGQDLEDHPPAGRPPVGRIYRHPMTFETSPTGRKNCVQCLEYKPEQKEQVEAWMEWWFA